MFNLPFLVSGFSDKFGLLSPGSPPSMPDISKLKSIEDSLGKFVGHSAGASDSMVKFYDFWSKPGMPLRHHYMRIIWTIEGWLKEALIWPLYMVALALNKILDAMIKVFTFIPDLLMNGFLKPVYLAVCGIALALCVFYGIWFLFEKVVGREKSVHKWLRDTMISIAAIILLPAFMSFVGDMGKSGMEGAATDNISGIAGHDDLAMTPIIQNTTDVLQLADQGFNKVPTSGDPVNSLYVSPALDKAMHSKDPLVRALADIGAPDSTDLPNFSETITKDDLKALKNSGSKTAQNGGKLLNYCVQDDVAGEGPLLVKLSVGKASSATAHTYPRYVTNTFIMAVELICIILMEIMLAIKIPMSAFGMLADGLFAPIAMARDEGYEAFKREYSKMIGTALALVGDFLILRIFLSLASALPNAIEKGISSPLVGSLCTLLLWIGLFMAAIKGSNTLENTFGAESGVRSGRVGGTLAGTAGAIMAGTAISSAIGGGRMISNGIHRLTSRHNDNDDNHDNNQNPTNNQDNNLNNIGADSANKMANELNQKDAQNGNGQDAKDGHTDQAQADQAQADQANIADQPMNPSDDFEPGNDDSPTPPLPDDSAEPPLDDNFNTETENKGEDATEAFDDPTTINNMNEGFNANSAFDDPDTGYNSTNISNEFNNSSVNNNNNSSNSSSNHALDQHFNNLNRNVTRHNMNNLWNSISEGGHPNGSGVDRNEQDHD